MKSRKGFTLIDIFVVLVIMATLVGVIGNYVLKRAGSSSSATKTTGQSSYENKLRGASEIVISEKVLTVGKHYDVYVGSEKVADVTGKAIEIWGDVFTLKTVDGKVLASEKECKSFLKLNRSAICYDKNSNVIGYIGEEKISDLLSWSYVFHFYDLNQMEIGKSKKLGKSALNKHKLYDNQGNVDYDVDKKLNILSDKYVLKRLDFESTISLEFAIFIVCIEDAIADAH